MGNKVEHWVSSKEIAEHLGITKDTLHRWIKNKGIPCHRVGRLWKFKISEIDEWIKNGGGANVDKNKGVQ
jgi:excisionase family DNA binding protein